MAPKRGTPEYNLWRKSPAYDLWRARNSLAHKGKHPSAETLVKLSAAKTGERNPMYGKRHTEEARAKNSAAHTGERNHNYGKHPHNYGKHHSAETLAKLRAAKTGERHPMYGKHHSTEARAKIRAAKLGKHHSIETRRKHSKAISGERNHNWLGGISFLPYPVGWSNRLREVIRKRDNYACALCGKIQTMPRHDVHHINYKKEDIRPENLITLCADCHRKTNRNRKYWTNLFVMVYISDFPKIRRKNESSC